MKKFAFIVHPASIVQCRQMSGRVNFISKLFSDYSFKRILKTFPPYKYLHLPKVQSMTGNNVEGFIIVCPLVPDQLVAGKGSLAKDKIIAACKLAEKFNVNIIGLGGFTSIVTNGGEDLLSVIKTPLTTGNTYTSCLAIDGIFKIVKLFNIELAEKTVSIVGATGDIGSMCSIYLSRHVKKLFLIARDSHKLVQLKERILKETQGAVEVECTQSIKHGIEMSGIIITATSSFNTIIDSKCLQPGSIICDVSYPANINVSSLMDRPDVFVFKGGMSQTNLLKMLPRRTLRKFELFNPPGVLHGCLAETVLLALEGKFENYSIGRGNITLEKIDEIRGIGVKHGYYNIPFLKENRIIKEEEMGNFFINR